ncbi:MAG TPA: MBL fold metallo-hydrolase [Methylomirabilota bacterium]|nr:MBL fold metallo-hydrolase [Methylomirabilota bacterium]
MHFAFLGTSGAVPSATRDTTALVVVADEGALLIDCGGSPAAKLRRAGVDPLALTHVLITHIHPDHAYGLPALVQSLMLLGRERELVVLCRPEHLEPIQQILSAFDVWGRPGKFVVRLAPTGTALATRALELGPLVVSTTPNDHGSMPNYAVRVDVLDQPERGVVYSSDTAPCDAVVALARGAHTLVHEATFPHRDRGRFGVHSTAREAGEVAARAGVRRLILAHIEADYHDELPALAAEAQKVFGGTVEIAREFVPYEI